MKTYSLHLLTLSLLGCRSPCKEGFGRAADGNCYPLAQGENDDGDSGDTDSGDADSGDTDSGDADSGDTDSGDDIGEGTWERTGEMSQARYLPAAVLLPSGLVLITGGIDSKKRILRSAELFDPTSEEWTPTGSMTVPRWGFMAALLPSGQVLAVGGYDDAGALSSAELYDPETGTWSEAAEMGVARAQLWAVLLTQGAAAGKVLAAGGHPGDQKYTHKSVELYDPDTDSWETTGAMNVDVYWDTLWGPAVLDDGSLLAVGGVTCCSYTWLNKAEIFDASTLTWELTSEKTTDAQGAVLMADGRVLAAGGTRGVQPTASVVADAEIYDPSTGGWTSTESMNTPRDYHTLTLLPGGDILAAGGYDGGWGICVEVTSAERYDPATGQWSAAGDTAEARINPGWTLLPDGRVLLAGGRDCDGNTHSSAELYTP